MRDKRNLWWRYYTDRYPHMTWAQINKKLKRVRVRYNNQKFFKMRELVWNVHRDVLCATIGADEDELLMGYDKFYLERFPWRQVTPLHIDQITRRLMG